jgi:threonine dehydrogenase-like Zn-dependent dehydrogenase
VRTTTAGGKIVMIGCCNHLSDVDTTFLWAKHQTIVGITTYGPERYEGERLHTFELTLRKLVEYPSAVAELVTHEFSLHEYEQALSALYRRSDSGAIKVVLRP